MARKEVITCDFCGDGMLHDEVAAGAYGVEFHLKCFKLMNAAQLAYILGIDDVRVYENPEQVQKNEGAKLNSYIRRSMRELLNANLSASSPLFNVR